MIVRDPVSEQKKKHFYFHLKNFLFQLNHKKLIFTKDAMLKSHEIQEI